jgi:autotransporter-associated beta strand protein
MYRLPLTVCATLAFAFLNTSPTFGQYSNPNTPIVFNGTSIDVSTLYPTTTLTSYPLLSNPVDLLGSGTLTSLNNQSIGFQNAFTGTAQLTVNLGQSFTFMVVGEQDQNAPPQVLTSGLNLKSGSADFGYGSTVINGPFSVNGNSTLNGNVTITSNTVNGNGSASLTQSFVTFSGAGPNFNFAPSIDPGATPEPGYSILLTNTSGTQTFSGLIDTNVARVGEGGTTLCTGLLEASVSAEGGTLILSGSLAAIINPHGGNTSLLLQGGTLVLDNTFANNPNRISTTFVDFNGGNLTVLGVNGGVTNQQLTLPDTQNTSLTGPVFASGLNVITVTAGTGTGSSAALTFTGAPTVYPNVLTTGAVDFEGLGANAQVFFTTQGAGAIAPWATFGGTDFAGYDSVKGVVPLAATGRPTQVNAATASSYVLASGTQTTLTANAQAAGVTMNAGGALDLGGNTLQLGAWIQNSSTGTIQDGTLQGYNTSLGPDLCITTNANLTISASLAPNFPGIIKNGPGTLNLVGALEQGVFGTNSFPLFYINSGTITLNVTTPLSNDSASVPTFTIGESAGGPGTAALSLLANGQFATGSVPGQLVTLQILQAGQLLMNGFIATVGSLEVDGGSVNENGGVLMTGTITANPLSVAGQISGGVVNLTGSSPTIAVTPPSPGYAYQASADGLIISSKITSSSPLTKSGNGVLVLGNAANAFGNGTVGLIVNAGTVALQNTGSAGSTNAQIQLTNYGGIEAETTGTLIVTNPVTLGPAVFSGSPLVLSGGVTQTTHGTIGVSNTTVMANYTNNLSPGSDGMTGSGTLVLTGAASGTCTGTFTVSDGVLGFAANIPLPTGMTLLAAGGAFEAVNSPVSVNNPLNITVDTNFIGSQPLTFFAATGNAIGAHVVRALYVGDTQPVTITNLNAQQSTLICGGPGTLVLAGNPTNLNATQITGGTLELQNAGPSVPLGLVTISTGATLNLNNSNATVTSLSGSGSVAIGTGMLSVLSGTFSGGISGAGSLAMTGTGALVLSGPLTYTGPTSVVSGTLTISDGLSPTAQLFISSGATMNVNGGNLYASGNLTNSGTLVLGSGVTAAAGGTFTNNGTLDLRDDPGFVLPKNFVNNGTVLVAPGAQDTPVMPPWALALMAVLLALAARRATSRRLA